MKIIRTKAGSAGRALCLAGFILAFGVAASQAGTSAAAPTDSSMPGGPRQLEAGQPVAMVHATVEAAQRARAAGKLPARPASSSTSSELNYHGGTGGVGVETAPQIYVIFWGSQWNNNDPSGEASILETFYSATGGSSWSNTVTQYCEGVAKGTVYCNGTGTPAGNPAGIFVSYWYDNASTAPTHPKQSQIASEAVRAAQYFGQTSAGANANVEYVIATAHGNNSSGFGTQYCAWHSSTSSTYGNVAYTNLPYITDAGANCGANFNGLGPTAGITIVGGHEMAETMTDPFPSSGWLDSKGLEIGDKCAWISSGQGASADVSLNGSAFPVQSLWSDAFNSGSGGCVLSY